MQDAFEWWQALVGLVVMFGVWIAWRQYKSRKPDTTNIAQGSSRVKQSGGNGTTRNEARDSEDVDQAG